jgi:putative ATPase
MDLFDLNSANQNRQLAPLAYRMRPRTLDEVVGQPVAAPGSLLRRSIEKDELHSFVLYGPPGTGKTSIARIIADVTRARFEYLKAVTSGVNDIRQIAADAAHDLKFYQRRTILFVDEIHRFNKAQQDVLLPFVEDGTLILIGATTENPLYELNTALLSRLKLYILDPLKPEDIRKIIGHALVDKERGLGNYNLIMPEESMELLISCAKGDARTALNIIDTLVSTYAEPDTCFEVNAELVRKVTGKPMVKYDRSGDYHYDTISAYIKSIRGSDPDAAIYWLAVMLEGGESPKFIARRLLIHAAEDIGLADPTALALAAAAAYAADFVGLPEARIPLAEATIYLSTAPKSNSSKTAIDQAMAMVRRQNRIKVPAHLGDTSHSQAGNLLGKGGYKYPHDYNGYVEQNYLPEDLLGCHFYEPGSNGYETVINKFLKQLPDLTKGSK